jgi:hypothetical protein
MSDKERRERVPFSANRRRLALHKELDGFVTRWFNDQDDRLQRAEDAGYQYVHRKEIGQVGDKDISNGNTDVNSRVSRVVGRNVNGQPIRAYLMKIRKDWYEQDQAKKEEVNKRVDDAIRAGTSGGANVQNQYGNVQLSRAPL